MKQYLLILLIMLAGGVVSAQQPVQQRPGVAFEISEYGVDFQADPRLITVMAALDYRRLCEQFNGRPSLLFVAHRRHILDQSRATYATVLKDPDFGEMVERVSQQLALDSTVSAQLHELLLRLSAAARPQARSS